MSSTPKRKFVNYQQTVRHLDALGATYHFVCDAWANGYNYECYRVLCEFYNEQHTSEVIFDNLVDLLDDRFFNIY